MPELFPADFPPAARWSPESKVLAFRCLGICGYHDRLVDNDYFPSGDDNAPLIAFAHRPFDARSSCMVLLPQGADPERFYDMGKNLAAPVVFVTGEQDWQLWLSVPGKIRMGESIPATRVEQFFTENRTSLSPQSIFRAKAWARVDPKEQLDFVDMGLLPYAEYEAGSKLVELFERMVSTAMGLLHWKTVPATDDEAHWLVQACFWLLAAKLLHDKAVPSFVRLDLEDIDTVFARVGRHYGAGYSLQTKGRAHTLRTVAGVAKQTPSLKTLSIETLGALYEESLITPTTRKLLGTHRTPTYLVDYMLASLDGWIEEIGVEHSRFYEPACGHAPFLVGSVRKLSNMLPDEISQDSKVRQQFLRQHIRGNDSDSFALEIARLSLTLADIPNGNGWILQPGDMFSDAHLDESLRWASVMFANPPFENQQAAGLFHRALLNLNPGSVLGIVLPGNILGGKRHESLRRLLLSECEVREISVFPDKMFRFASVETGIILARKKTPFEATAVSAIRFRRVREAQMNAFREKYLSSWNAKVSPESLANAPGAQLIVPELERVWEACRDLAVLSSIAAVTKGFDFRSTDDPLYPRGQITTSEAKRRGFVEGFKNLVGTLLTHLTPKLVWLNKNPAIINAKRGGTVEGIPQVLQAYSPTDRDPWRHKAFIDEVGRRATSRFIIVRPKPSQTTLKCIWAICSSPIANAFTFSRTGKRDITVGVLKQLYIPRMDATDVERLEVAVDAYLLAAREASAQLVVGDEAEIPSGQMDLFSESPTPKAIPSSSEQLRALHWRIDAEVLRLYKLPPAVERELLDFFSGVRRWGVPFLQKEYIPQRYKEVQTLDDYLRVTDEWDATESRRCELIEKRIKTGSRSAEEESEFRDHQRLLQLRRRLFSPLPISELESLRQVLQ